MRTLLLTVATTVALAVPAGTAAAAGSVVGTVGPGFTITLKTPSGAPVKTLPHGLVTFTIHDRSANHDFHLVGPGVDDATAVETTGTTTWKVKLQAGKTYTYECDPHKLFMIGRFKVR